MSDFLCVSLFLSRSHLLFLSYCCVFGACFLFSYDEYLFGCVNNFLAWTSNKIKWTDYDCHFVINRIRSSIYDKSLLYKTKCYFVRTIKWQTFCLQNFTLYCLSLFRGVYFFTANKKSTYNTLESKPIKLIDLVLHVINGLRVHLTWHMHNTSDSEPRRLTALLLRIIMQFVSVPVMYMAGCSI